MKAEVDIRQLAIVRDEVASPKARRRRHLLSRYIVPGTLLVGFLSLVFWASRDTLLPPQPVWVVPVLATHSTVQHAGTPLFQAAGWIEPRPTAVRVAALAPGVVERLLVVQDQLVKAGEPVAELIKVDAQLAHDRAVANFKLEEAELKEVEADLRGARTRFSQPVHLQAALSEAESALAQIATEQKNLPFEARRAQSQFEFAEKDYEGKQTARGAIAGRQINEAKSALETARATVEELQNRADSLANQRNALIERRDALQTQLKLLADETQAKDGAEAKVQAAKARVEQARVALAEAKLRLDRMTVRAPTDGRVYQLMAYPGTTLTAGMAGPANADASTVVTLYAPEMLQVRVDARFEDVPKVNLGQTVTIKNPAIAAPLTGHVLFVSSEANIQKNTLQVKVAIDTPPAVFKPEMLVDVTFLATKPPEAVADVSEELRLYVPQQLVQRDEGGACVWLADQTGGVARKETVTTGNVGNGGLVEVTGHISIASRIIARGQDGLSDGKRIRVVGEDTDFAANTAQSNSVQHSMSRLPQGGK
jgi:HlyD family secretion protein